MLEIRHFMSSCDNFSHSFSNTVLRYWMVLREGLQLAVTFPRASQTYCIGLKSGNLLGQTIQRIYSVCTNSWTRRALRGPSLSSILLNSVPIAPLKEGLKNLIPVLLSSHNATFEDMQGCDGVRPSNIIPAQIIISVSTMVDFVDIAGQVAGPWFSPYQYTTRFVV